MGYKHMNRAIMLAQVMTGTKSTSLLIVFMLLMVSVLISLVGAVISDTTDHKTGMWHYACYAWAMLNMLVVTLWCCLT